MLASSVVKSAAAGFVHWLVPKLIETGTSHVSIALNISAIHITCAGISLAGIVLLVYAFWIKFKGRSLQ